MAPCGVGAATLLPLGEAAGLAKPFSMAAAFLRRGSSREASSSTAIANLRSRMEINEEHKSSHNRRKKKSVIYYALRRKLRFRYPGSPPGLMCGQAELPAPAAKVEHPVSSLRQRVHHRVLQVLHRLRPQAGGGAGADHALGKAAPDDLRKIERKWK